MDSGTLSGIVTAVLIVAFVGICAWAWSARRRKTFDAAARMPLEDDEEKRP
ncbi:MAG TPA: cbb3-type cytochrome c oxidase subunit 3 [Steroidobacteraceae bacterium]|nr:cbb3-type cytochrome c oxidase subunit 3 [Steroidobacteraceae bacterium]